jgi:beta-galactosidase
MDEDGIPRQPGGRRHYCPNSPQYRQLTRRLVLAMAERYGNHPDVIGWQIDNEFGDQGTAHCYCPNCLVAFQQWLQERYLTLDALNHAWGNVFWSQTFTAWEQIRLPVRTLNQPNPCASLDFFRFASSSVIAYQQLQIDALHSFICQDQFITHNLMWLYTDIDYFKLSEPLDFLSYDSYPHGYHDFWRKRLYADNELPVHYANDVGDPILTSFSHDLTRSLSKRPFWIMEQQAGHINWSRYNAPVRAGAVRLWTWHAAAAGAEAVVYFRERECPTHKNNIIPGYAIMITARSGIF